MALQTVAQKLATVEKQSVVVMHDAVNELRCRLEQLSALLLNAAGSGLTEMEHAHRSAYLWACFNFSEQCEDLVHTLPLPAL